VIGQKKQQAESCFFDQSQSKKFFSILKTYFQILGIPKQPAAN